MEAVHKWLLELGKWLMIELINGYECMLGVAMCSPVCRPAALWIAVLLASVGVRSRRCHWCTCLLGAHVCSVPLSTHQGPGSQPRLRLGLQVVQLGS